jgi:hypothetical protein
MKKMSLFSLFFLLIFGLLVPEVVQAQGSVTIVDNSAAPVSSTVDVGIENQFVAQEFTTPNNGQNYVLDSVTLAGLSPRLTNEPFTTTLVISLYSVDSSSLPDASLEIISTNIYTPSASSLTVVPTGLVMLSPNTSYYIVLNALVNGSPQMFWGSTTSTEASGVGTLGNFVYESSAPPNPGQSPWTLMPGNTGLIAATATPLAVPETSKLTIGRYGAGIILTWPTNATGFALESTTNLSPATWSQVAATPVVVGGQNIVMDSIADKQMYYRLAEYSAPTGPTFDTNWISLGNVQGVVYAAAVDNSGNLYIGGSFTSVGGVSATNVAEWNGTSWSALGSGISGMVGALVVWGTNLVAGGYFAIAGGVSANDIALWNGNSWSALGTGINNPGSVYSLATQANSLYVGGGFSGAGGVSANNIALWNGNSWSALGSGINGNVFALAVSGTNVYAGGFFATAGGVTANCIAQWNGSSWSALGSGIANGGQSYFNVRAMAMSGTNLFVGGYFTNISGVSANNIAVWNGTSWSALGSGTSPGVGTTYSGVEALTVLGTNLYVGGLFTNADDVSANYIAQWNRNSWSALGSGISGTGPDGGGPEVNALAVSANTLYVGGDFKMAGTNVCESMAEVILSSSP